ncbi:hypothetical protein ABH930_006162 [Kitasatospora sp. GAS204A]|nr:hypothetical protein [Kitasatospora sp. GAS204B]
MVVGSAKGAAGASTTALALAAAWPGEVQPLVLEADTGQLVLRRGVLSLPLPRRIRPRQPHPAPPQRLPAREGHPRPARPLARGDVRPAPPRRHHRPPRRRPRSRRRPRTRHRVGTQTQATRTRAEAELRTAQLARSTQLTRDDTAALARANSDLVAVLRDAEPADRAVLYQQLGLILTYGSGKQEVLVEMNLNQHFSGTRGLTAGVRGGTCATVHPGVRFCGAGSRRPLNVRGAAFWRADGSADALRLAESWRASPRSEVQMSGRHGWR